MIDSPTYSLVFALLFWLGVAGIWGYFTHGIVSENKKIKENQPTVPTMHYLLSRLAALQKRNLQLWCAVSVLFFLCAVSNIADLVHGLAPRASVSTEQPVTATPQPAAREPVQTPAEPPASQQPEMPSTAHPMPASTPLPYSDITEFNEKDSKQQAMIDWLKQRYENTLITFYYLQKCNLAEQSDFDIIVNSLRKELADLKTITHEVEDNILMAANGSYNELYAQASCEDERSKSTKTAYDAFMQQLRAPKPATATATTGQKTN